MESLKIKHIALIPDGNRRWAKAKGLDTLKGHKRGLEKIFQLAKWCKEAKVKYLTVFCFSTENWQRPKREVSYLMELFKEYFKKDLKKLKDEKIKVKVIGDKKRLPQDLRKAVEDLENSSLKKGFLLQVNLALSYGGRWDILEAVRKILEKRLDPKNLTLKVFEQYLSTKGIPDPDILIRTGKEIRISNFLIWQSAYSELFFVKKYWPDFTKRDFKNILKEYTKRQRRFGR